MGVEDDDGDLAVAEDAQLVRFLHQTELPLGERHLTIPLVRNSLDGYFLSTHDEFVFLVCVLASSVFNLKGYRNYRDYTMRGSRTFAFSLHRCFCLKMR